MASGGAGALYYQLSQESQAPSNAHGGRATAVTFASRPTGVTATTALGRVDVSHDGTAADGKGQVTWRLNAGPTADATVPLVRLTTNTVTASVPTNVPSLKVATVEVQATSDTLQLGLQNPATDQLNTAFTGPGVARSAADTLSTVGLTSATTETVTAEGRTAVLNPLLQVSVLVAGPGALFTLASSLPAAAAGFAKTVLLSPQSVAAAPTPVTVAVMNAAGTTLLSTVALQIPATPSVTFTWTGSAWRAAPPGPGTGWEPSAAGAALPPATVFDAMSWPVWDLGDSTMGPWTPGYVSGFPNQRARWIAWHPSSNASSPGSVTAAYYQWVYNSGASYTAAIVFSVDDYATVYVNGQTLGTQNVNPTTLTATFRTGWNLVRVDALNSQTTDNPAGLIAVVTRNDTGAVVLRTDASWRCTLPSLLVDVHTDGGGPWVALKQDYSLGSTLAMRFTHSDTQSYYLNSRLFAYLMHQVGDILFREDGQNSHVLARMKTVAALEAVRTNVFNGSSWFYNTHGNNDLTSWIDPVFTGDEITTGASLTTYPPSGLSSNTSLAGYEAAASKYSSVAYKVFDYSAAYGNFWQTDHGDYNKYTGLYAASTVTRLVDGTGLLGEWLQLKLPVAVKVASFTYSGRTDAVSDTTASYTSPRKFTLVGSITGREGTWMRLGTWAGIQNWTSSTQTFTLSPTPSQCYPYIRLVVHETGNWTSSPPEPNWGDTVTCSEFRISGYPGTRRIPDAQQAGCNGYTTNQPYYVFNSCNNGGGAHSSLSDRLCMYSDGGQGESYQTSKLNSVWVRALPYPAQGLLCAFDPSHPQSYPGAGLRLHDLSKGNLMLTLTTPALGLQAVPPSATGGADSPGYLAGAARDGYSTTAWADFSAPLAGCPSTFAVWVRLAPGQTPANWTMALLGNYPATNNLNWEITAVGVPRVFWNNGEVDWSATGQDVRTGLWEHLCWVRDTGASTFILYRNGVNVASRAGIGTAITPASAFRLGNNFNGPSGYIPFQGHLGGFQLWNRTLSAAEVTRVFMVGRPQYYPPAPRALVPLGATGPGALGNGLVMHLDLVQPACCPPFTVGSTLNNLVGTSTGTLGGTYTWQGNGTMRLSGYLQLPSMKLRTITLVYRAEGSMNFLLDARTGDGIGYIWHGGQEGGVWGSTNATMSLNGAAPGPLTSGPLQTPSNGWQVATLVAGWDITDDITLFGRYSLNEPMEVTFAAVLIWNRALTAAEQRAVFELYKDRLGLAGNAAPLVWVDATQADTLVYAGGNAATRVVQTVRNASGSPYHMYATLGAGPVYNATLLGGQPGLDFTNGSRLMSNVGLQFNTGCTLATVFQLTPTMGSWGSLFHHGFRDDLSLERRATDNLLHWQANRDTTSGTMTWAYTTGVPVLFLGTLEGGTVRTALFLKKGDTTPTSLSRTDTAVSTAGVKPVYIGASELGELSNSFIGELRYYNTLLSAADRASLWSELRTKWDI